MRPRFVVHLVRRMAAIPQVLPSDPEDVVWALQTAETLWKRDERSDAIVWLRRAAQAAGEAELDERALELSKIAADLSDALKAPAPSPDKSIEIDVVTDDVAEPAAPAPAPAQPVPSFPKPVPKTGVAPPVPNKPPPLPPKKPAPPKKSAPSIPMDQVPPPPVGVPGSTPPPAPVAAAAPVAQAPEAPAVAPPKITPEASGPRRHDSGRFAVRPPTGSMPEIVAIPEVVPAVSESMPPAPMTDTEVTTGPQPSQVAVRPDIEIRRNPSMTDIDAMAGLPPLRAAEATPVPESTPTPVPDGSPSEPTDVGEYTPQAEAAQAEDAVSTPDEPMRESLTPRMELSIDSFDAFADLPDDQREALQKSAFVMSLKEGAEIPSFALAIVLGGDVDVAAHGVDAPAVRLPTGHVLYGRGSIDSDVPMRLLGTGTGNGTEVAVWSRDDVAPIMKGCPWVEDDLRAAADPVLAAVGVTMGAFGARLDPTLRGIVTARLAVHSLASGDVLFPAGKIVPGLFVVGAGVIELVKEGAVTSKLGPGDFIFPGAVVGGSNKAAAEARASDSGALVLSCDRKAAQELLMTCPPLLEILASL